MPFHRRLIGPLVGLALLVQSLFAQAALDPARLGDVHTAEEARRTIEYIRAELPKGSGLAAFNDLYLTTTRNMQRAVQAGRFENSALMDRFTGEFANLYFSAIRDHLEGSWSTPLAWQVLFKRAPDASGYRTVQFALAGMNAHIGRDLPILLRSLFADRGGYPACDSSEYRDYQVVNQILGETYDEVEDDLFKDLRPGSCEILLRGGADLAAIPSLKAMRFKAWFDGKALWNLKSHNILSWNYVEGLDVGVAASNRAVFALKAPQPELSATR